MQYVYVYGASLCSRPLKAIILQTQTISIPTPNASLGRTWSLPSHEVDEQRRGVTLTGDQRRDSTVTRGHRNDNIPWVIVCTHMANKAEARPPFSRGYSHRTAKKHSQVDLLRTWSTMPSFVSMLSWNLLADECKQPSLFLQQPTGTAWTCWLALARPKFLAILLRYGSKFRRLR